LKEFALLILPHCRRGLAFFVCSWTVAGLIRHELVKDFISDFFHFLFFASQSLIAASEKLNIILKGGVKFTFWLIKSF
jgi:hypothetical protein